MPYKKFIFIFILYFFAGCTANDLKINQGKTIFDSNFKNRGFALIYSENLYNKNIISEKIDERSLTIFQNNLKKNTLVKITNILNNKSLVVNVGKKSNYPSFNNSVISQRIADDLEIDINEPYVEIIKIPKNSLFIAKKAEMYEEEKKVSNKAPVNKISISNLNKVQKKKMIKTNKKFSYIIKIADFYFNDTASLMVKRIKTKTNIKKIHLKKLSDRKYRVYLGPFNNINSLQNSYNDVGMLEFENIEIIKND